MTNPRLKTTTFGYDPVTGDMTSVTDPLQKATTFGYDAMGRRNRVTDPLSNSTSYSYDVRAQLTRVTFPDTKFIAFTYDQGGRRTTVTDQLGRVTTYGYDSYGRLATVTDANTPAGVTRYGYDAMSHLTTITDARNKVTTFHYDAFGRVDSVSYPGAPALTETFTYYPTGRLKTRTDRNGLVATFTYDDLGRLAQKTYSDGSPSVTYSSDLADRLTSAVNAADNLTWVYDLAGQLESESSAANSSLVEYLYDGSANRTQLKLNGVVVLGYVYDDDDRLQAITRGSSSFGVTYDDASRRTGLNFPNSAKAAYTYDTKSRLTGITTTGLDSHGRTVTLTSSTYTYNAADNRLTKGGDFAEAYTYDPVYRLTQVKRGTKVSETYTYDGVGNRLSALNSSPWSYDDRNELLSYPTATFQYDLNGNATQRVDASGTWAYEWNAENQLTRVLKNGVEQARYAYDPIGRRVEKVAGTVTTAYLYDGPSILREMAGSAVTTYIQGPGIDEPIAREDAAGNRTYYHADGLGSLVKETNSAGTVTLTRKYDAFGSLQLGTNSGYAFTGREWESEVGLAYYRARYYDPKIGRFLSEDPIVIERRSILELNAYTYVGNSPTGYIDPYGLERRNTPYPPPPPMRGPGQIKDEAARRAQQRMRPDPNRSGGQDDEEDALRHCLAGCMMSRELGENVSFLFGFANEVKSDLAGTQTYEQRAMDLHNNAIGCAAASGARSTADCEQRCLQQMPVLIKHVGTGTPYP